MCVRPSGKNLPAKLRGTAGEIMKTWVPILREWEVGKFTLDTHVRSKVGTQRRVFLISTLHPSRKFSEKGDCGGSEALGLTGDSERPQLEWAGKGMPKRAVGSVQGGHVGWEGRRRAGGRDGGWVATGNF